MPEILRKSVAGEVTALVNSCGALGAFLGTWFVGLLLAYTGNSRAGFLLMSLSLMLAGLITLGLRESANNSLRALSSNPVSAEAG